MILGIVCCSLTHLYRLNRPAEQITNNLIETSKRMLQHSVQHVFVLTLSYCAPDILPQFGAYHKNKQQTNALLKQRVAEHKNMTIVDLAEEMNFLTMTVQERAALWDDALHFTPAGYDRMAQIIFDQVSKYLATL